MVIQKNNNPSLPLLSFDFLTCRMAVAIAVWDSTHPQIAGTLTSSVLNAWSKTGLLHTIMHVHVSVPTQTIAKVLECVYGLPDECPVIVIAMGTTALTVVDWAMWVAAWMRSQRCLWCTRHPHGTALLDAVYCETTLGLPWHSIPNGHLPAWGLLGGVASMMHKCLAPFADGGHTFTHAIGKNWVQDQVAVDDTATVALAWVWDITRPLQVRPPAHLFHGNVKHRRLVGAMPLLVDAVDKPVVAVNSMLYCLQTSQTARYSAVIFIVAFFMVFIVCIVFLSSLFHCTKRKPTSLLVSRHHGR